MMTPYTTGHAADATAREAEFIRLVGLAPADERAEVLVVSSPITERPVIL